MKKIETNDDSVTFFSEEYQEHYHSTSGAMEEAFEKYAEPCKIRELAREGEVNILDVCFGIGYNSLAAVAVALEENPKCRIQIIGLENDRRILDEMKNVTLNSRLEPFFKILKGETIKPNVSVRIIVNDARVSVKNLDFAADAVFFDPFSPKKCPELWTVEFFSDVKKVMKKSAVLATYSCARIVRENLRTAGFEVHNGPCVGRRAPSTIAVIK